MNMRNRDFWGFLFLAPLLSAPGTPVQGGLFAPEGQAEIVGVLLFGNSTGTSHAVDAIMPRVYDELEVRGVNYVSHAELRSTLRKHRIRAGGGIGSDDARAIREETGTSHLVLGSFDIFKADDNPEVAVSIRAVDTQDLEIVGAASAAATGEDYAGLFGVGRIDAVEELAMKVVSELFEALVRSVARSRARDTTSSESRTFAIVSFDNSSDTLRAGQVISSFLISALTDRDFTVIEPGRVSEVFRKNRRVWRGGIDLAGLARLTEALEMDFVLTGEVEAFLASRGATDPTGPSLSLGARMLSAPDGRVLMTYDDLRNGSDSETLLRLGKVHSLGELTRRSMDALVSQIAETVRTDHDRASGELSLSR